MDASQSTAFQSADKGHIVFFVLASIGRAVVRSSGTILPSVAPQTQNYHTLQRQLSDSSKVSLTVLLAFLAVEIILQETFTKILAFVTTLYTVALRFSFTGLHTREFKRRVSSITFPMFVILSAVPDAGVLVLTCISVARCMTSPLYATGTIILACLPLLVTHIHPALSFIWTTSFSRSPSLLPGPGDVSRSSRMAVEDSTASVE
ncbi:hypothetical protein NEOLEDRAFT_1138373 [Neolentinus lepideus HHB14362 ss-1]|uniref:Uncharacterized protein n=1 Tax=Neolentinus lepideus HHB14362 ss-1 TaxID=1314782 RepID=A0A165QC92_9AGAM|nr:hypothetical protein NEOLEDRAFT_1138373 [Neolentinus lepideus HHB14362 ss-1]